MNISPELYKELNKAWNSTCRVVLGEEIGELKDYESWLRTHIPVLNKKKSSISGKDVSFALGDYCDDGNFVSQDEVKEIAADPLTINEVKDLDSILEAVSEKWQYVGNKVAGKSKLVESSDTAVDANYVYDSTNIGNYQHGAILYNSGFCKYMFGCGFAGRSEFVIGSVGLETVKRSFSSADLYNCSDTFMSHNLKSCQDMIFSFHQINKKNCIGNLELPKDKYLDLKKKILGEAIAELKANKKFPHVYSLVPDTPIQTDITVSPPAKVPEFNKAPIDRAFASLFKMLLKVDISDIDLYGDWLIKHTIPLKVLPSPFGSNSYISVHPNFELWDNLPKKRLVTDGEALQLQGMKIGESDIKDLEGLRKWFGDNCTFCEDYMMGNNKNHAKSTGLVDANNIYRSYVVVRSDNIGFTSWGLLSKNVLGSFTSDQSQFCINIYNSGKLTRCFEVDSSANCADAYFCHNCDGVMESMFCWNAKGKRYAIGNHPLPPDKYRGIKETVLKQLGEELLEKKELKLDIFNICCKK